MADSLYVLGLCPGYFDVSFCDQHALYVQLCADLRKLVLSADLFIFFKTFICLHTEFAQSTVVALNQNGRLPVQLGGHMSPHHFEPNPNRICFPWQIIL